MSGVTNCVNTLPADCAADKGAGSRSGVAGALGAQESVVAMRTVGLVTLPALMQLVHTFIRRVERPT